MAKNTDMNNAQNSREPGLLSNEDLSQVAGGEGHDPTVNFPCGLCGAPRMMKRSSTLNARPFCEECTKETERNEMA